jgi:hypothetical protein
MKPYVQESQKANKARVGISGFLSAVGEFGFRDLCS